MTAVAQAASLCEFLSHLILCSLRSLLLTPIWNSSERR